MIRTVVYGLDMHIFDSAYKQVRTRVLRSGGLNGQYVLINKKIYLCRLSKELAKGTTLVVKNFRKNGLAISGEKVPLTDSNVSATMGGVK